MNMYSLKQNQIIEAIEAEDFDRVIRLLEEYRRKHGEDDFFWLAYSDVYFFTEQYDKVLEAMEAAQNYIFDPFYIYEREAEAYIGLKEYQKALDILKEVDFSNDSEDTLHVFYLKGEALSGIGEYQQALECYENILLETSDELSLLGAAKCYIRQNKVSRGFEYFLNLLEQDPIFLFDIITFIGNTCPFSQLLSFYNQIQHLSDKIYTLFLTNVDEDLEDVEKALPFLEQISARQDDQSLEYLLFKCYQHLSMYEQCTSRITKCLSLAISKDPVMMEDQILSCLRIIQETEVVQDRIFPVFYEYMALAQNNIDLQLQILQTILAIPGPVYTDFAYELAFETPYPVLDMNKAQVVQLNLARIAVFAKQKEYKKGIEYILSLPDSLEYDYDLVELYWSNGQSEQALEILDKKFPDFLAIGETLAILEACQDQERELAYAQKISAFIDENPEYFSSAEMEALEEYFETRNLGVEIYPEDEDETLH